MLKKVTNSGPLTETALRDTMILWIKCIQTWIYSGIKLATLGKKNILEGCEDHSTKDRGLILLNEPMNFNEKIIWKVWVVSAYLMNSFFQISFSLLDHPVRAQV